jgi:Holliday junction resolvase RusA-like endonuclease
MKTELARIAITPMGKPRMTQRDRWAQRPAVTRYHRFCDELRLAYPEQLPERLYLEFHIPMAPSWSKNKRALHLSQPHKQKPDIDNLCKAVLDALAKDDSYIHDIRAKKFWTDSPGVIVIGELDV